MGELIMKSDKKLKEELVNLIEKFGYWSTEVKEFNGKLDPTQMLRINDNINHRSTKSGF